MEKHRINLIKAYRRSSGLTQEELGFLLGLADGTVSRHELGRRAPTLELALGYSLIFGISIAELLPEFSAEVEAEIRGRIERALESGADPRLEEVLEVLAKNHGALREDSRH